MGPKTAGLRKVYFLKSTGNVGDVVDITEYIIGGDFNMNPKQSERRPNEVPRREVLHFIESVLGIEPGLVRSVIIEEGYIEVDLVTLRIVD